MAEYCSFNNYIDFEDHIDSIINEYSTRNFTINFTYINYL